MALSVWGRPRTTLDLDFLVLTDVQNLEILSRVAVRAGLRVDQKWLKWNPLLRGTQLRLHSSEITVDLLVPRDEHDRAAFRRKRRRKLGKKFYSIISPEDFILQKLKVGRPRDFEDAVTVLERLRGTLSLRYLRGWARRLGILGELDFVLKL